MRSTLILGIAIAACASAPAIGLAQQSAAKPVRHHHYLHRSVHQRAEAEAVSPNATAQIPAAPILSQGNTNGGVGAPGAEWDYRGGNAGFSWEPYGWAK